MKKILFLIAFVIVGLFINAQTLSGRVVDAKTGVPLSGVHIVAQPSKQLTITNYDGSYKFKNFNTNDSSLKVTMVGYNSIEKELKGASSLDFEMTESTDLLSETVVTGTRTMKTLANTPVLTKVIDTEQIERLGANTALEAIEYAIPGIEYSTNHGLKANIHGLTNYGLILIDGQKTTKDRFGNPNLIRIQASDIERIEVLNGAASVLYGSDALSSVINIITKKNKKKWQGNVGVKYNENHKELSNNVTLGYKNKGFDLRLTGNRRSSDGFTIDSSSLPPFEIYTGSIAASYELGKKAKVYADYRYFRNDYESSRPQRSQAHQLTENNTYNTGVELRPTSKHLLKVHLNSENDILTITNRKDKEDLKDSEHSLKNFTIMDTYSHSEDWNLIFGAEYHLEEEFSLYAFEKGITTKDVYYYEGFIQSDYKIIPKLDFIAGVRYTKNETFGGYFTPNFTLMKTLGNFKLRGSLSWGYKAPDLKSLYHKFAHPIGSGGFFWILGNRELKPETSFYNAISVEYTKKNFNASVNFFKNKIEDQLSYERTSYEGTMALKRINVNAARIKGIETFVNIRFLDNFTSRIGYNYLHPEDVQTGEQLNYTTQHFGTIGLSWNSKTWKNPIAINLNGRTQGSQTYFITNRKTRKIEKATKTGYSVWKASYTQDFKLYNNFKLKVQLGVDNIFDYTERELLFNSGRTFWIAVKLDF